MDQIQTIQNQFSRFFIPFLWANLIFIALSALWTSSPILPGLVLGFVLALLPTLFWLKDRTSVATRYTSAVSSLGLVAIMVFLFHNQTSLGQQFQVDMHMYFFVVLAMIAGWCDWRTLIVGAATAAVHHLGLNFIYPLAIFPEGADLIRVILHAVMVVVEVATLVWLTRLLVQSFTESEKAVHDAETAKAESERLSADQNQSHEREQTRASTVGDLLNGFDQDVRHLIADLGGATGQLESAAQTLLSNASATVEQTKTAEGAGNVTANNVSSVASATEELSASIREISQNVASSTQVSQTAVGEIDGANGKVQGLAEAANKIGEVVSLISDIAEQTNLLALNATIEAARAGDAGKGFAVVANEVKSLANQTARATEDISAQVESIQSATRGAVDAIGVIGGTVTKIDEITSTISASVEEQGAATQEIARSAEQASSATQEMSGNIHDVSTAVLENQEISGTVMSASSDLNDRIEKLRARLETFLTEVKAV